MARGRQVIGTGVRRVGLGQRLARADHRPVTTVPAPFRAGPRAVRRWETSLQSGPTGGRSWGSGAGAVSTLLDRSVHFTGRSVLFGGDGGVRCGGRWPTRWRDGDATPRTLVRANAGAGWGRAGGTPAPQLSSSYSPSLTRQCSCTLSPTPCYLPPATSHGNSSRSTIPTSACPSARCASWICWVSALDT